MANNLVKIIPAFLFLCVLVQGSSNGCDFSDIEVTQNKVGLFKGKPLYEVVIANSCKCSQYNVTLKCVGFGSYLEVDPKIFKQEGDYCLVNTGKPITEGSPVKFQYSWLTPYDLIPSSSTVKC